MTSTPTAPDTDYPPAHRERHRSERGGLPAALRILGLVATLVVIAALEYGAGQAAGWGILAYGVPLAIDSFVLGVLLSPRSRLADRLFALALVESTVVVSAVWGEHGADAKVLLGAALATALVASLWRQDETIRRERGHADLVAAATARADAADAQIRALEQLVTAARTEAAQAVDTAAYATADAAAASAVRDAHAATIDALRAELARAHEAARRRDDDRDDRRAPRTTRTTSTSTTTTDADRARIIRLVLAGGTDEATGTGFEANPAAGKRTIADAIRACKHTPGGWDPLLALTERVRADLVREGHHIAAVRATGTD